MNRPVLTLILLLLACRAGGAVIAEAGAAETVEVEKNERKAYVHMTIGDAVRHMVEHPAFKGFGMLMLPRERDMARLDIPLGRVHSLMPYHEYVNPDIVVETLNHMIDEVREGKTVFYDFYSELQKREDAAKKETGIFFFRGEPGAPFAVVCPGGGFSYVASLHEGFPLAWEISRKGYNAFVIRYRIGSQQKATEDLGAAIGYIFKNAATLGVGTEGYSLWGGSAGARMVGNIALHGTAAYGGGDSPKPSAVVMAYTGQTGFSGDFPPTFMTVSANDGIVKVSVVDRRAENLRNAGVEVEYHKYKFAGHGFGLGRGTDAEGWLDLAVRFWEKHMPQE